MLASIIKFTIKHIRKHILKNEIGNVIKQQRGLKTISRLCAVLTVQRIILGVLIFIILIQLKKISMFITLAIMGGQLTDLK